MLLKCKVTDKELKAHYDKIVCIPYCKAQHLLTGLQPNFYNSGVYGWKYDAYDYKGILIVTGYNGFGKQAIDVVEEYERQAKNLLNALTVDEFIKHREILLDNMVKEIFGSTL